MLDTTNVLNSLLLLILRVNQQFFFFFYIFSHVPGLDQSMDKYQAQCTTTQSQNEFGAHFIFFY